MPVAVTLAMLCLLGGSLLAVLYAGSAPWIFLAYVVMNIAYSLTDPHLIAAVAGWLVLVLLW